MSWDLNLCMSYHQRVLVPFHYFVTPKPQLIPPPSTGSFPFFKLPVDLQLIVYEHCDGPTLFQLMRTCSRSRHATAKLFWNNAFANQWFYSHDDSLFEHMTPTYVFTRHCPEFACQITNIEIDLIRLELRFIDEGEDRDAHFEGSPIAKAKVFWAKVGKVFPSVKRVVLTGCTPREPHPPPSGSFDEDYACIETIPKHAPAHIKVYIAFVAFPNPERDRPPRNTLWRVSCLSQPAWQLVDPDWKPIRVLLPNRKWAVSPLGDFLTFNRRLQSAMLEMRGLEWLMVESYARYAVGAIHCPRLDCSATFEKRLLWKQHLFDSGHGRFEIRPQDQEDPMSQLLCNKHTPEVEKLAIEARQQLLANQYSEAARIERRVGHGWGPPGSEQRRLFEQEIKSQMHKESIYTPDEPSAGAVRPDQYLFESMSTWFDRTHIYHSCSGEDDGHICYGEY